jgi:phosphoenolpyruvate carboxylase
MAEEVPQGTEILKQMLNELKLAHKMIDFVLDEPLSKRRENHYCSTLLRAEAMDPLHDRQIFLLKRWRQFNEQGKSGEAEKELFELLRCINAIAGAIGFTG